MRFSSHWHLFVLLALVQSFLVLLGVVYLFRWFEATEIETIRQNSLAHTEATASQIGGILQASHWDDHEISEPASNDSVNRFRRALSGFKPVQDSFVCFVRPTDGAVLYHRNQPEEAANLALGSIPFSPVSQSGSPSGLIQFFKSHQEVDTVSGMILIDDQYWLGSAQRLKKEDAIVMVLRNESARMHRRAVKFSDKRTRTLLLAFLLSFIAIAIPIIGLHHYDDQLRSTNNDLERQATYNERELTRTRNAVIFGLAKLAESRDNDTGEHLDRIRKYVEILSCDLAKPFPRH